MFEGIMSKIRPRTAQELRDGETSGEKLKTRTPERTGKEDASPKTGKCKKCGAVLSAEVVKKNLFICPECGGYFRLRAYRRILMLADTGSFTEWDKTMPVQNPLDFPDYEEKILETQEETGLNEAVVTGRMKIEGIPCAIGVCDARYLMSSMGHNMGEKIARLAERAEEEKLPLIIFSCSGGARMQEGIISLMQMVKTSEAIGRLQASGQLFISFLTDPTMGGVTASFAMLGDIILAEPGALIGFTGQRVIQQTIGGTLPEGFQKAEFQLEHGFADAIVERKDQKKVLAQILRLHGYGDGNGSAAPFAVETAENEKDRGGLVSHTASTIRAAVFGHANAAGEFHLFGDKRNENGDAAAPETASADGSGRSAWETVRLSRNKNRARALDYIHALFPDFMELHGDRCFGDDGAVVGGIASFHGTPVTVIGIQKGRDFAENKKRNFGMPNPEGYRKALRLMQQAEKFRRPVICFVDTPGAYCGIGAEERGQGLAIADNLRKLSALQTPILSIVIGEGSSGGALALATADEVWIMENAVYSILSPEGFSAILYRDAKRAPEAAEQMHMTSADLLKLGVVERVIPETVPVTENSMMLVRRQLSPAIGDFIRKYTAMPVAELVARRYRRYRRF